MDTRSGDPIWEQALDLIATQVNEGTFRIWFEPDCRSRTGRRQVLSRGRFRLRPRLDRRSLSCPDVRRGLPGGRTEVIDFEIVVAPGLVHASSEAPGARTHGTPAYPGLRRRRHNSVSFPPREAERSPSTAPSPGTADERRPHRLPPPSDRPRIDRRSHGQEHFRHIRRRPVQSLRSRRSPCGRGTTRALSTTRSSSTAASGSARPISSKPSATMRYATTLASRSAVYL